LTDGGKRRPRLLIFVMKERMWRLLMVVVM
jgi:hypothetical protein